MKTKTLMHVVVLSILVADQKFVLASEPLATGWTYQGELRHGGSSADGEYDFIFRLFDADIGGGQIGAAVPVDDWPVMNGLFTVQLDFGASAFTGDARWLEIAVRPGDSADPHTILVPRQPLTGTPYALQTRGIVVDAAKNVGIGTASPDHLLHVAGDVRADGRAAFGNDGVIGLHDNFDRVFDFRHTTSDFSSTDYWTLFNSEWMVEPTFDLPETTSLYSHFFWIEIPPSVQHDVHYMQGPFIYAGNNGTGTVDLLAGAFISAQSDGDVAEHHLGCEIGAWAYDDAVIANNYALSLRTGHWNTTTGSIENNYALYLDTPETTSASIMNNYGIYMADQSTSGTNENYAIYSAGGKSYFADRVGIGEDSPAYPMHVVSDSDHAVYARVEADVDAIGFGVYGQSDSASGGGGVFGISPITGVKGIATAEQDFAVGGWFEADGTDAYGVYGHAKTTVGGGIGVYGKSDNPGGGYAGFFEGARSYFSDEVGIGISTPTARLHVSGNGPGGFSLNVTDNLYVDPDIDFVGVNRWVPMTSAEYFGIDAPVGDDEYGGMYMRTQGVKGLPFYGYSAGADLMWTYYDGETNDWHLHNGGDRLTVTDAGDVGIGDTTPDARLDVTDSGATVAVFNRTSSDGTVIAIQQDTVSQGSISVSGTTVSYNAFTGSHFGWTDQVIERGTLVSLTGVNRRYHDDPESEIVYGIAPSTTANDPSCLGAYLGLLEPTQSAGAENPHLVAAVGNGEMWVIDTGVDIKPGDSLISSGIAGHAMKDDERQFPIGHVVARAAEAVQWDNVDDIVDGRRHKPISVTFESFLRGDPAAQAAIDALRAENESLRKRLERVEALLTQK